MLDNLSSHKVGGVREAIEAAGATVLYLPPYSPDLNPIELAFSKLKRLLRDAPERTFDGLWQTIGRLLERFSPGECTNYMPLRLCTVRETAALRGRWRQAERLEGGAK